LCQFQVRDIEIPWPEPQNQAKPQILINFINLIYPATYSMTGKWRIRQGDLDSDTLRTAFGEDTNWIGRVITFAVKVNLDSEVEV
jgi:hypothetical protein